MNARSWFRWCCVALATGCSAGADLDTQTFELKYLEARTAAQMIGPYVYADRPNGGGQISIAGSVITVRETHDNLERIARVLAQYDRPAPAIQLTFRVIEADGVPTRDPAIADVEVALRRLFRFRGYRLLAEGVVGGVEGSDINQTLGGVGGPYYLETEVRQVRASGDSATVQLRVRLSLPRAPGTLQTVVSLPVGKTAVLGNARSEPKGGTLILTVRPDLVAGTAP